MPRTITAEFDTRREAEMAVEHFVQEHGLDRGAIGIVAATAANSAGTHAAGGDVQDGHGHVDKTAKPALGGALRVTAAVDDDRADKVLAAIRTYGGRVVP